MISKKRLMVCLLAVALAALPAYAILGVGDIVFDPSNYAQAVQQLLRLEQQYAQLVKTYETVQAQYDQMLRMARQVPIDMSSRYKAASTPWAQNGTTDTYGSTGGWLGAVTAGQDVLAGYQTATQKLETYGNLADIPEAQRATAKSAYATVELSDGANVSAIQTIGQLRQNSSAVETAIRNLQVDSLSSDPSMNTEIAVLNKMNAAGIVALRNTQDTNKLLVALAEGQVVEAKRVRDAEAQAINQRIRFASDAGAMVSSPGPDPSTAMRNWRMP